MFEDKMTSLGTLPACDQLRVRAFLRGSTWEEQFKELDDDSGVTPPDWITEWSKGWQSEPLCRIEGDDWWICEYQLVFDKINNEAWIMVYQNIGGDDDIGFEPIATDEDTPTVDEIWDIFLKQIESLGDSLLRGTITIDSIQWLPQDRMTAILKRTLIKHGESTVGGLSLEKWLLREYGNPNIKKSSTEARDA